MEKIEKDTKIMVKPLSQILDDLDEYWRRAEEAAREVRKVANLSIRELEVLRMIAAGSNNREIANQLSISEATVKAHIRNIMDKMQVKNRPQVLDFLAAFKEKSKSTKGYLVIFEKTKNNYSVYSPDLPGCIATGRTKQEAEKNIKGAIKFHLEGLKEDGLTVPEPSSFTEYVEV